MHKNSGRSLAVRVGALTAALSLMLAGGVAMASSASASGTADKDSAPGQQSAAGPNGATKPDKNGNPDHGDNGGANTPGNNQNGNNGNGGTGHLAIDVCHATRSASNPYVFITVDFSSVDEAWLYLTGAGKGNGHGDHVGQIWDGQRSGVNWGDIIGLPYPIAADSPLKAYQGYNLGATSVALGNKTGAEILAAGCSIPPTNSSFPACVTLTTADPAAYSNQTFSGAVGTEQSTWLNGDGKPFSDFTVSSNAASTDSTVGCGTPCNPDTQICSQTQSFESGVKLCVVEAGAYTGITSVPGKGATQKDADQDAVNAASAKGTGDNIVPPAVFDSGVSYAGYNWNEKTQARFESGNCSPALEVISATPLPGTVAPAAGKPAPAKTPAKATMPATVPAGDGSSVPGLPVWALAMVIAGAIGAAAAGKTLLANRK